MAQCQWAFPYIINVNLLQTSKLLLLKATRMTKQNLLALFLITICFSTPGCANKSISPEKREEMEKTYNKIALAEQGIVQLNISLKKDSWEKLRDHAESKGITYQEMVEELIAENL